MDPRPVRVQAQQAHRRGVPAAGRLARLTTRPANGIRSSVSRSTKYAASRNASGSGAATTTNAVPSACNSANVSSARERNPPNNVSNAATNVCMSVSTWAPMILFNAPVITPSPIVISRAGPFAGASNSRMKRPSKKLDKCSGASKKSNADRDGGVSTTIRS